jgi:hypothetical protein
MSLTLKTRQVGEVTVWSGGRNPARRRIERLSEGAASLYRDGLARTPLLGRCLSGDRLMEEGVFLKRYAVEGIERVLDAFDDPSG